MTPGRAGPSRARSRLQGGTALIPSAPSVSLCVELDPSTRPGDWGVATSGRCSADHSHPTACVPRVLLSSRVGSLTLGAGRRREDTLPVAVKDLGRLVERF